VLKKGKEEIDRNLLIEEARYIVVDTELTGLDLKRDFIISIGAIKMNGGRIIFGDFFYRIVKTDICSKNAILIHEITPSESALCPDIKIIMKEFLDNCANRVIVGHFIDIDINFLNREIKRLYGYKLKNPSVDTYKLYKWIWKRQEKADAFFEGSPDNKSLFELSKKFGIPVGGVHNAIYDAFVTAQLFQRFLYILKQEGIKTLKDLLKVGQV
jgi:DNA polymerase-3 subunit epsilon